MSFEFEGLTVEQLRDAIDFARVHGWDESVAGSSKERELFDYWRERCGHEQAKLTSDRRTKLRARLRDGYTPERIMRAIDGAAAFPFVVDGQRCATGAPAQRFDDLELICRNGSKLEAFERRAPELEAVPVAEKLIGRWENEA